MPYEKAGGSKETTKVTGVDTTKSPAGSAPVIGDNNSSAAPSKTVQPGEANPANVAATDKGVKSWLSLRKLVPVLVLLMAAAIFFAITSGWNRWVGGRSTQRTDDAILRADITPLSTRVSGTVAQVAVTDYQQVKAGDLLVQLKDNDFKAQVAQAEAGVAAAQAALLNNAKQKELQASKIEQAQAGIQAASAEIAQAGAAIEAAKADVANAQAGVDAAEAKIPDSQASVEGAQADAERTLLERRRQEALVDLGSATKQKLEQVVADQERYAATLKSRKAELAQTRALLESQRAGLAKARSQVSLRQAEQQQAIKDITGAGRLAVEHPRAAWQITKHVVHWESQRHPERVAGRMLTGIAAGTIAIPVGKAAIPLNAVLTPLAIFGDATHNAIEVRRRAESYGMGHLLDSVLTGGSNHGDH